MKGFWRTVESVFAVILLVSFLLTVGGTYFTKEETDLSSIGYEMLKELDGRGELRPYVVSGDYGTLNSKIEIPGYGHSIKICDYEGSCAGEYPDSNNIIVSTYLISGHENYEPFEVRLHIWW
jgi:hypothetical protein